MRRPCETSSRRRRAGITLVETIAGTALLGTLLASVLIAHAKIAVQARQSRQRMEACGIADELLRKWYAKPAQLPRDSSGTVEGKPLWRWQTRTIENSDAAKLGGELFALDVFADGMDQGRGVHVELLAPKRQDKQP